MQLKYQNFSHICETLRQLTSRGLKQRALCPILVSVELHMKGFVIVDLQLTCTISYTYAINGANIKITKATFAFLCLGMTRPHVNRDRA